MKYNFSTFLAGKLDKAKGRISDVSIITEGPALGHGVSIDTKTLSGIFDLMKGKPLSAHWTHGGMFSGDRLGEEVGLFSGFHISGNQLKANFQILEAFKSTYPERYAYLFELAEKAPGNFGVSIHFEGEAVWTLDTGAEVSADGERPSNAVGEMPVVRVHKMNSADFVSEPAANAGGLFSAGKLTELLDEKQKLTGLLTTLETAKTEGESKLAAKEAAFQEINGKFIETVKVLEAERLTFAAKETEFAAQKTAFEAKISELNTVVTTLTASIETAKADAITKENEYKVQIAAMNKTLLEFGAVPVNIYQAIIDHRATLAAIQDPAEKTAYWNKHKAAILAQG